MIFGNTILNEQQALNEAYFGKTKELLKMEATLDEFRKAHMGDYGYFRATKINSDKTLQSFNRQVEDYFGFGCFCMHIHNSDAPNAFTLAVDSQWDYINSNTLADTTRFKFNKDMKYSVVCGIYNSIIFNPEFTTEEVMAIILHEIGHNFNSAINHDNAILSRTYSALQFSILIISTLSNPDLNYLSMLLVNNQAFMQWATSTEQRLRQKNSNWIKLMDSALEIRDLLQNANTMTFDMLRVFTLGFWYVFAVATKVVTSTMQIVTNPMNIPIAALQKKAGKGSEKSADNFATMYGYGGALSSALEKMGGLEGSKTRTSIAVIDQIPILGTLMHTVETPALIIVGAMDTHPAVVERTRDQLALLKRELAKEDIDPKMRKQIEADIKQCEEALDKLTDTRAGVKDPYVAQKLYNKFLNYITKADVFKGIEKDQEKRFSGYDNILYNH